MPKTELHLALTEETYAHAMAVLFPPASRQPEHGVMALVAPSTGTRRRTLLVRRLIEPKPAEVTWDNYAGLLFSPRYKSRAVAEAADQSLGIAFIHTHPRTPLAGFPFPSAQDFRADARDLFFLGQEISGPLVAIVVARNGRWSVREYQFRTPTTTAEVGSAGFRWRDGRFRWASTMRIVGPRLRAKPCLPSRMPAGQIVDEHAHDSSIRLWGREGQQQLARLRVGISGLGGVGGILAEHLARLGMGELHLIDFDRLTVENLNRSVGATRRDAMARKKKVAVAARNAAAAATAPNFRVRAVDGSVVEAKNIPFLLDCDIILNAADSPWARQVLDHIAYAHLIPVVNGGTDLRGNNGVLVSGKSEVASAGTGHACFECSGVYDRASVNEAIEAPQARGPRRYLQDAVAAEPERAPSVISNNALVSALMELRLTAIALGTTPGIEAGTQRFYPLDGSVSWAVTTSCRADCKRAEITALGDTHWLPTGTDLDLLQAEQRYAEQRKQEEAPHAAKE